MLCNVGAAFIKCRSKTNEKTKLSAMFEPFQEESKYFQELICYKGENADAPLSTQNKTAFGDVHGSQFIVPI